MSKDNEILKSQEDRDIFFDALKNPPEPNDALKKAKEEILRRELKQMSKRDILNNIISKQPINNGIERWACLRAMDAFAEQEVIGFNEWVYNNNFANHTDYSDSNEWIDVSSPGRKYTTKELYQKYCQWKASKK